MVVDDGAHALRVVDQLLRGSSGPVPGIELREPGAEDGPASLAIALGLDKWALIHTDENMVQHRSVGSSGDDLPSIDVEWEEPTLVPQNHFVDSAVAADAVAQWLVDRTLSDVVVWSAETY